MDRQAHLKAARNLAAWATTLHTEGEYLGAGELIWGATVHAVSAADPEHEAQLSDRYSNPHQAPNTKVTLVAFRFRWFGYKMGVQCPPYPPLEMRRYGTAGPPGNPTGTPNPRPTPSRPPTNPG